MAQAKLGVPTRAIESHSAGDYIPNLASVARQGYDAVVAAGFLLADAEATVAKKFPNTQFAITDYPVEIPPFSDKKGKLLVKNITGITFKAEQQSYLVGCLSALMAKKGGGKHDQRDGRRQDPAGRLVHRRLRGRCGEVRPGHEGARRVLAGLHRAGQVQGSGREPDRRRLQGRLRGRRPLRLRRARGGEGGRVSGATASTSTSRTSARTS